MPLDLDPNVDLAEAKPITLGRRQYHVAPLPLRHVLAIVALLPKVNQNLATLTDGIDEPKLSPVVEIIRRALIKAYPAVTADDILDLPVTIDELIAAVPVVIAQSGGRRNNPEAAPGEAAATSST
jgi:hypothetical protein